MAKTDLAIRMTAVANELWTVCRSWDTFSQVAMGKQIVSAADSVGSNLVEGDARYSDADAIHFFIIARGSLAETEYRLGLARDRELLLNSTADRLLDELKQLGRMLNALIDHRRRTKNVNAVREDLAPYASLLTPDA